MPTTRPLAIALCLALVASTASPGADAAKRKKHSAKKTPAVSLVCSFARPPSNALVPTIAGGWT